MKFPHCVPHFLNKNPLISRNIFCESEFLIFPHCEKNSVFFPHCDLFPNFDMHEWILANFTFFSFLYRIVQQTQETFDHYFHANQKQHFEEEEEIGENVNILNLENDWEELENDVDELATQIQVPKSKQSFT